MIVNDVTLENWKAREKVPIGHAKNVYLNWYNPKHYFKLNNIHQNVYMSTIPTSTLIYGWFK